jgi:hypothetical protein
MNFPRRFELTHNLRDIQRLCRAQFPQALRDCQVRGIERVRRIHFLACVVKSPGDRVTFSRVHLGLHCVATRFLTMPRVLVVLRGKFCRFGIRTIGRKPILRMIRPNSRFVRLPRFLGFFGILGVALWNLWTSARVVLAFRTPCIGREDH